MERDVAEVFDDLVRVETILWNGVEAKVVEAAGVPLSWVEIAEVVAATKDCRVLDVARAHAISVGGASKIVDRLQTAQLCRRERHPSDGRSQVLVLTAEGRKVLRRGSSARRTALEALLSPAADRDEVAQLGALLQRVRHDLTHASLVSDSPTVAS